MMAFNKRCRFAKGARRQKSEGLPRLRARGPRRHLPLTHAKQGPALATEASGMFIEWVSM